MNSMISAAHEFDVSIPKNYVPKLKPIQRPSTDLQDKKVLYKRKANYSKIVKELIKERSGTRSHRLPVN